MHGKRLFLTASEVREHFITATDAQDWNSQVWNSVCAQTQERNIFSVSSAWIHSRWSLWHNVCGKYKWLPWKPISSLVRIWRCLWYLLRWRGRWGWFYEITVFKARNAENIIISTKGPYRACCASVKPYVKKMIYWSVWRVTQRSFQKHDDLVIDDEFWWFPLTQYVTRWVACTFVHRAS